VKLYVTVSQCCHDGTWTQVRGWRRYVVRIAVALLRRVTRGPQYTVSTRTEGTGTTRRAEVVV
jgi:hypothetical protein